MSARVFLELLLAQYRLNSLYVIGNMLQGGLDELNLGDPLGALANLSRSEKFLLAEMRVHPQTVDLYTRDLAVIRAVKKMIEQDHILF